MHMISAKTTWLSKIFTGSVALLLSCMTIFIFTISCSFAANIATAGQDDGYSGRLLDKITKKWKPPHPLGKYRLNIVLAVESDGTLADCRIQKSSGIEALDVSACAAARAASPFGSPPYGMPASIFFSFWSDNDNTPRTKPDPVAPDALLAQREMEAARAANERAQAAAETAAKKTGKKMPASASSKQAAAQQDSEKRLAEAHNLSHTAKPSEKTGAPAAASEGSHIAQTRHAADKAASSQSLSSEKGADYDKRYAKYISRLRWDLRNAMFIPKETRKGVYHALVEIKCDRAGKILSAEMLRPSGDKILDRYVMKGIDRAGMVVPPPDDFGDTFKIDFKLVRN